MMHYNISIEIMQKVQVRNIECTAYWFLKVHVENDVN